MNKPVKLIAGIIFVALGLLLALGLYLAISFDPNNYRNEITARVQAETGRTLTFQDDIELQLFPWIGLKLGVTQLSGPENFHNQDFVTIQSASIKARLIPLLQQQLEVDTIILHGLNVKLITDANDMNNWDFTHASPDTQPPSETDPASAKPGTEKLAPTLANLQINGLDLSDATISWFHTNSQTLVTLDQLALTTGPIGLDQTIDINLSFNFMDNSLPEQALAIGLSSRAQFSPEQQTAQLSALRLQVGDLQLSGDISTAQLNTAPKFSGQLQLADFKPRTVLQQLGLPSPNTQDPAALHNINATLQFTGDENHIEISDLKVQLDETTLQGQVQLALEPHLATTLTLAIDTLDIDRYLPPPNTTMVTASNTASAALEPATLDLPLELLRTLTLQGQINIGKLKVAGLRASNIATTLSAKDGLIGLQPLQADLYQGHSSGKLLLDARPVSPRFSIQEQLDGFQAEPFLKDLLDSDLISGQTALKLDINTQGNSLDELTRKLNGKASFVFNNGAIKGINIADLIRRAQAKIKKRPVPEPTLKQTDFTDLSASVTINNGIISNQDLNAQAPFLRISGNGTSNLVNETIDYQLRAKIVEDASGQGGAELTSLRGTTIPIRIRGPLTNPAIKLDSAVIKKKLRKKAQQKIKTEIKQQQDDIKTRLQDQARDKLKQKLKKLF